MGNKLLTTPLVGLSYSICSQGDRLTGAFNYYYPLPEGPILKKIVYTNDSDSKCQQFRQRFGGLSRSAQLNSKKSKVEIRSSSPKPGLTGG